MLKSPAELQIFDSSGNRLGFNPDGTVDIEIPTGLIANLDAARQLAIILEPPPELEINVLGTHEGFFDLSTVDMSQGLIHIYEGIQETPQTEAQVTFSSITGFSDMLVDTDGDGTIDQIKKPEVIALSLVIEFDIKPQSCPNPLNTKSKGVLPVAILGTTTFDVNNIDQSSVQLEGVSALRSSIDDVSTPVANRQDPCDCTTAGADGFNDLELKFDTQDIVAALGTVNDGDTLVLTLTGNLLDGTDIEGQDCVIIKSKGGGASKSVAEGEERIPESYALVQNYPNPFNPETEIRFQIPEASHVVLRIFNTLGEEIRTLADAQYVAGYHSVRWDSKDNKGHAVSSGIYFYQMQTGNFTQVKKMSLLR